MSNDLGSALAFRSMDAFRLPAFAGDGIDNDHANVTTDTTAPHRSLYNINGKPDFTNSGMPCMDDVKQEKYGDCYFDAVMAALAQKHPEQIKNMIHDNGNGTFTVTFPHQEDNGVGNLWGLFGDNYHDVKITVSDADLPSDGTSSSAGTAKWPEVLEAAYAKLRGGYDDIGHGGNPTDAMQALTGKHADYYSPEDGAGKIAQAWRSGKPVTVSIRDSVGDQADMEAGNTPYGLMGDHAYTVVDIETDPDGTQYVKLRNPWGSHQPHRVPLDAFNGDGPIEEVEIGNA